MKNKTTTYTERTPREQRILDLCYRASGSFLCDIEDALPFSSDIVRDLCDELKAYLREGDAYAAILEDAKQVMGDIIRERGYISLSEWWYKEKAPARKLPLRQAAHRQFLNRMGSDWRNSVYHQGRELSPYAKKEK